MALIMRTDQAGPADEGNLCSCQANSLWQLDLQGQRFNCGPGIHSGSGTISLRSTAWLAPFMDGNSQNPWSRHGCECRLQQQHAAPSVFRDLVRDEFHWVADGNLERAGLGSPPQRNFGSPRSGTVRGGLTPQPALWSQLLARGVGAFASSHLKEDFHFPAFSSKVEVIHVFYFSRSMSAKPNHLSQLFQMLSLVK